MQASTSSWLMVLDVRESDGEPGGVDESRNVDEMESRRCRSRSSVMTFALDPFGPYQNVSIRD